ncbi:PfkB family carbohydrate kinase [Kribbella sp. NPDC051952]|uniref:PfkB family carbohydrate kinase n=1 Tax=Kribbella sp. NPDC051952 TaxID=3154851 RepID=UPI003415912A
MAGDLSLPSEAKALVYDFTVLRKNQGLKQIRVTEDRAGNLLGSRAVRDYMDRHGVGDPAAAAVQVVIDAVRRLSVESDQIVADGVLGLGLFQAEYIDQHVDPRVIQALQTADLGDRRDSLRRHWHGLHEAVGAGAPETPGDRYLRDTIEPRIFRDLAMLIADSSEDHSQAGPITTAPRSLSEAARTSASGRVVVVGGVAMDHVFHSDAVPLPETSVMAGDYIRSPGGKGLSQAVAAARLGLDVVLIAACADDQDGERILQHLETEKVDTSRLKILGNETTPQTAVIEFPDAESAAVVWHNESAVSLTTQDVHKHRDVLAECDAVLLTFEIPQDVLSSTLNLVSGLGPEPPVTVVTPGQPYDYGPPSGQAFAHIDYLVAHSWELRRLSYYTPGKQASQHLGESFLRLGVKSVCVLGSRGGTIYSQNAPPRSITPPPSMLKESSITRDLFCAALVARLVEDHSLTDDAVRWATAAMASFTEDYANARTFPDRNRVDQMLRAFPGGTWH